MEDRIAELQRHLGLAPHPEGGYFCEVYRSAETLERGLPKRFKGKRVFATSIYFLLPADSFSAFHRLKQDEVWHYYEGDPLCLHCIDEDTGKYFTRGIGPAKDSRQAPQTVIPAGTYFAAEVQGESYTLCGCSVSPGFEFEDFEMPGREKLLKIFPQHKGIIERFTRD